MLHMKPKLMAALLACVMMILAMGGVAMGTDASAGETVAIQLSVNGYELVFQGPLTEGIIWQEIPETEEADLRFCMPVRDEVDVPLFIMTIGQEDGDYAMTLQSPGGRMIPVAFNLAERPTGLTDEERWAFVWAQADVYVLMETLQAVYAPEDDAYSALAEPYRLVTDTLELTYDARWGSKLCIVPEEHGTLAFNAVINGRLYPVFVLRYGADDGNFLITLQGDDGRTVDISFDMLSAPAELTGEERKRFYEVQEIISEINSTLTLR